MWNMNFEARYILLRTSKLMKKLKPKSFPIINFLTEHTFARLYTRIFLGIQGFSNYDFFSNGFVLLVRNILSKFNEPDIRIFSKQLYRGNQTIDLDIEKVISLILYG